MNNAWQRERKKTREEAIASFVMPCLETVKGRGQDYLTGQLVWMINKSTAKMFWWIVVFTLLNNYERMASQFHWLTKGEELGQINRHKALKNLRGSDEISAKSPPKWEKFGAFKMLKIAEVRHTGFAPSGVHLPFSILVISRIMWGLYSKCGRIVVESWGMKMYCVSLLNHASGLSHCGIYLSRLSEWTVSKNPLILRAVGLGGPESKAGQRPLQEVDFLQSLVVYKVPVCRIRCFA